MVPRVVVVLLLLALATGAAWLVLAGANEHEPETTATATDSGRESYDPAELASVDMDTSDEVDGRVDSDADDPLQREEVVAYPTDSDGPTLLVVEAAGRAPVPFAEVFVGEGNADWRGREQGDGAQHWADLLLRRTPARRADAQGRVQLPHIRRRLLVAGRSGPLFGIVTLRANATEPVLELVPDQTLRVRVIDSQGQPLAGVPLGLCVDLSEGLQRVSRATTDEVGIGVLRHVQLFETRVPPIDAAANAQNLAASAQIAQARAILQQAQVDVRASQRGVVRQQREVAPEVQLEVQRSVRAAIEQLMQSQQVQRDAQRRLAAQRQATEAQRKRDAPEAQTWPLADFVVLAEVPQMQPNLLRVPAKAIPRDLLELRLPTMSSLVVRVLGPDGEALSTPCNVVLRVDKSVRAPGGAPNVDELCLMRADKPLGESTVTFAPVGLGLRFDVLVRFADNDFDFRQQGEPGPSTPAPHEIVVRTPGWFTVLAGRLVDERGTGLADLDAELYVAGAEGRVEGERLRLASDGHFELPLRFKAPTPPYTLEVQASLGARRFGRLMALPAITSGRRNEIGDVVLRELPALASGTVRDDQGQALPGAQVVVQVLRGAQWTEESFVRDRTDADGKFKIYGEPRAHRLQLRVSLRRHASVERAITFGEDVEITLLRNGAIRAAGTLPEFVPRGAVLATLTDTAGGKARDIQLRGRPNHGFEIRIDDLRPGTYDLAVQVRGLPRPLAVADRVVVPPGETVRPPTIDGLDLRNRLFAYDVRAVDQAGKPMSDPGSPLLVELHDRQGMPRLVPFSWSGGRLRVITDQPSVSVVGLASGHRPTRSLIQPGESTLTFRRVHPLGVQLPGLRALLGPEQAARISLVFVGDTGLPDTDVQAIDQTRGRARGYQRASLGKAGGASLGSSDLVHMALMFNGRYEVVLRVDGPGGRVSKTIAFVDAILDGAEPMTVTASPDVGAVRAALAELAARPPRGG